MSIEMKVITEIVIGIGPEKDNFLDALITEEVLGVWVIVGQDQDQEQVQIETALGVTNVGNMIILQKSFPHPRKTGN